MRTRSLNVIVSWCWWASFLKGWWWRWPETSMALLSERELRACMCACVRGHPCIRLGSALGPVRGRRWRETEHGWAERLMVYNPGKRQHRVSWCTVEQPQEDPRRAADARQEQEKQLEAPDLELRSDRQASSMNVLVVLPLLLLAVVQVEQVRAEAKAVKLCGREFLRAVVYTCGGSRWRRFLSETDMDADGETMFAESFYFHFPSFSYVQVLFSNSVFWNGIIGFGFKLWHVCSIFCHTQYVYGTLYET